MKTQKTAAWVTALGCLATISSHGAWTENFDSYAPGNITGNAPWVDWGGPLPPDVSTAQANSGPNSLALTLDGTGVGSAYGTDVYAISLDPGGVLTSGQWLLTYQLYMESGYGGNAHMYFSQLAMDGTGVPFVLGVDFNPSVAGGFTIRQPGGQPPGPAMVLDGWAEVRMSINLDADQITASYNNVPFYTGQWDIANTGTPSLGGINFWADGPAGATGTYYVDDFSLTEIPEPASLALLGLGGLAMLRRRRS